MSQLSNSRLVARAGAVALTAALACDPNSASVGERAAGVVADGVTADASVYVDSGTPVDAGMPVDAGGSWDSMPWDAMPWDATPWDAGGSWDSTPWDATPWDATPWDAGASWDSMPWDAMPWDAGASWDSMPWDAGGMDAGGMDAGGMDGGGMDGGGGGGGGLCCQLHGGYIWNPNTEHRLQCRVTTTITTEADCIAANGGVAPVYRIFHRGNANSDQSAVAPMQRSGLVTRDNTAPHNNPWILDHRFAQLFAAHVDTAITNAAMNAADYHPKLLFAFSECYGGGMMDNLIHTFLDSNVLRDVPMLLTSASRFDQPAFYPTAANPVDWAWALIHEVTAGTSSADALSWEAAENDDFRKNNMEGPQVAFVNWGEDIDIGVEQAHGVAILWSGRPKIVDGEQIAQMVLDLHLVHGYAADQIFVFYGDGNLPAAHVIRQQQGIVGNFVISRASEPQLTRLLNTAFNGGWPDAPEFVFFFANDHGYNSTNAGATPRQGGDPENEDDDDAYGDEPPYGEPDFYGYPSF